MILAVLQRAVQIFGPGESRLNLTRPTSSPFDNQGNRGVNDFYGNDKDPYGRDRQRERDPYGRERDPYGRENQRDQYGREIDGYSSSTEQSYIEYSTFNIFESAPRYGRQRNLLFEVRTSSHIVLYELIIYYSII